MPQGKPLAAVCHAELVPRSRPVSMVAVEEKTMIQEFEGVSPLERYWEAYVGNEAELRRILAQ